MIYRSLSLILLLTFASFAAFAANDPLKSLFLFQQQMAENGITSAMMKLGNMYEHGEGVKKSNAKALVMYQQAFDSGYAKADADIKRLKKLKTNSQHNNKNSVQKNQRQQAITAEQLKNKRQLEEQAKIQKSEKLARDKAALDKKRKQQAAQARRTKAQKDAKIRAAKEKRARAKKAKEIRTAKLKAARNAEAIRLANEGLGNEYEEDEETLVSVEDNAQQDPEKGFKSDPCKSKAARLLSICK